MPWLIIAWVVLLLAILGSGCGPPEHGYEFLVQVNVNPTNRPAEQENQYTETLDALRRRMDAFGPTMSPFVQPARSNQIRLRSRDLPAKMKARVRHYLTNAGSLEFRLVHEASDDLIKRGEVPPDYELLKSTAHLAQDRTNTELLVVSKEPAAGLNSSAIKMAQAHQDNLGRYEIAIQFKPEGARQFAELTRANVGRRLAILLNGQFYTAPTIRDPIEGGSAMISGNFEWSEASDFCEALSVPLPVPVTILGEGPF